MAVEEDESFLPLSVIDSRFLGRPTSIESAARTVAILIELSRVKYKVTTRENTSALMRDTETEQGMDGAKVSNVI